MALDDLDEVPDSAPDPGEELALREVREVLHRALGRLPGRERDAIVLRVIEGRSSAETAEALGISQASARRAFVRGITRLRKMKEIGGLFIDRV